MKKGIIEIEGMEFYAFHGCYKEEQIVGNKFMVDIRLECDVNEASKSDCIDDTVSYLDVYNIISEQMAIPSHILEHVAKRIIDAVMDRFYPQVEKIKVKVSKCNPPLGGNIKKVSVTLER